MEQNVLIKEIKINLDENTRMSFCLSLENSSGVTNIYGATIDPPVLGYVIQSLFSTFRVVSTDQLINMPARLATNDKDWIIKHFLYESEFDIEKITQKAVSSIMYFANNIHLQQSERND